MTEVFSTSILPSPRCFELANCGEPRFDVYLPIDKPVPSKSENGLHRVAEYCCGQDCRQRVNDAMLNQVAVLVLVDNESGIGRLQCAANVPNSK